MDHKDFLIKINNKYLTDRNIKARNNNSRLIKMLNNSNSIQINL